MCTIDLSIVAYCITTWGYSLTMEKLYNGTIRCCSRELVIYSFFKGLWFSQAKVELCQTKGLHLNTTLYLTKIAVNEMLTG